MKRKVFYRHLLSYGKHIWKKSIGWESTFTLSSGESIDLIAYNYNGNWVLYDAESGLLVNTNGYATRSECFDSLTQVDIDIIGEFIYSEYVYRMICLKSEYIIED